MRLSSKLLKREVFIFKELAEAEPKTENIKSRRVLVLFSGSGFEDPSRHSSSCWQLLEALELEWSKDYENVLTT